MTRIGWDLDGVHYLFAESVWETMIQLGYVPKNKKMPLAKHWYFYRDKAWGSQSDAEFVDICHKGADMGIIFTYGGFDDNSIAEMNKLWLMGYPTIIVTDRAFGTTPRVSQNATIALLNKHKAHYDEIYFTADKPSVQLDYMVDDKLENYDALDAVGVNVYLLNRPWNKVKGDTRRRVDSVKEYTDIILQEAPLTAGIH